MQAKMLRWIDAQHAGRVYASSMKTSRPWYEVANQLRRQKGLTYQQIADRMDCSKSAVGHWFTGHNSASLDVIKEIAAMLETSTMTLIEADAYYLTEARERELIDKVREVPPEHQAQALRMLEAYLASIKPTTDSENL